MTSSRPSQFNVSLYPILDHHQKTKVRQPMTPELFSIIFDVAGLFVSLQRWTGVISNDVPLFIILHLLSLRPRLQRDPFFMVTMS